MPLVSIVLPTRNRLATLPRAIRSVLNQSESDWELIVVDNSSPASSAVSILTAGLGGDPRVRLISVSAANNASAARNAGLAVARGEWVTFLDDDDAYHPEKIRRQLTLALRSNSPLVLCGARFHLRSRECCRHLGSNVAAGDDLLISAGLGTPFLFHRRDVAVRFDESLYAGEDLHYAHALLATFDLHTVPVVPEPLVEVFQDVPTLARTNLRSAANWTAARRVWKEFGHRYSGRARRLFVLRARITRAKLRRETGAVLRMLPPLFRCGGREQWRFALNATIVSIGWAPGRWIT